MKETKNEVKVSETNMSILAVRDIFPRKTAFRENTIILLISSVFKRFLKNPQKMWRYNFLRTFLIFLLPLPQNFKEENRKTTSPVLRKQSSPGQISHGTQKCRSKIYHFSEYMYVVYIKKKWVKPITVAVFQISMPHEESQLRPSKQKNVRRSKKESNFCLQLSDFFVICLGISEAIEESKQEELLVDVHSVFAKKR